jgi:hypothetical protein
MLSKTALAAIAALSFLFTTSVAPNIAVAAKDGKQASAKKSSKKSSKKVVNKKVVHKKVVKKTVVHRDGGRVSGSTVAFVTLGTPVAYRAYGAGWCRALHRGCHVSPGLGRHCGKHVGRVRC